MLQTPAPRFDIVPQTSTHHVMRWILLVLGVLVVAVLVVVVVGAMLPKAHVAAMRAHVAALPDDVWRSLTNPADFPAWRKDVKSVELLPATPSGPAWREVSGDGSITYAVDAAEPPRRLVTRITDESLPFGGTWEYRLSADGGGTMVQITEHGEVRNPVLRFVSRYVMGHTASMDRMLRSLGRKHGAEPLPEVVAAQ